MAAPALWLALTVALTATLPATQTVTVAAGPPPHELYIKAGLLIDGTSGAPRRDIRRPSRTLPTRSCRRPQP